MRLYQDCDRGTLGEDRAAGKAFKIAKTFSDWFTILEMSDVESDVAKHAIARLQNLAQNFDEWRQLFEHIKTNSSFADLVATCKQSLLLKADRLEDWLYIYQNTPVDSTEKNKAQEEIVRLAQSDDDWDTATNDLPDKDPLNRKRLEWRLEKADNIETLETIYDELSENDPLVPAIINKLKTRTDELSEWIESYNNRTSKDAFDEALFAKMLSLAKTPDDYIAVMEAAQNCHDDDAKQVLDQLQGVTWSKEQWEKLRDDAPDE